MSTRFGLSKCWALFIVCIMCVGCAGQQQYERDKENIRLRARAHTDLGAAYFQQKQMEVALDEFKQAIKIDPNFATAYNGLGLVNAELGRYIEADADFKKAIQLDPDNSEAHNNYGSFLCARNRIDESITEFLTAVKNPLYATPAIAYANAGICAARKPDAVMAEMYLNKALQLDPLSEVAAYYLASSQFNRKDAAAAKKSLQNALLTNPGPAVLWLGIQIERMLGAKDEEASYALQLRRQFPESEQAKLLQSGK